VIERPHWYVAPFVAAQTGIEIPLDTDAEFRATGVAVYCFSSTKVPLGSAGNVGVTLRFADAQGVFIQKRLSVAQQVNPFDNQAVNGAGGLPAPFYSYFSPFGTNLVYPPGGSILIDYAPIVTAALVLVVFIGTKMYADGSVWAPLRDPKKPARPFIGYSLQFTSASLPILNLPLLIEPDADFVWQCGSQTASLVSVGTQRSVGVKIKDWTGKYYMNDYIPLDLIFGFDNSQTPGLLYPEIYIPREGSLFFDLKEVV
jgi:hypothetical protein